MSIQPVMSEWKFPFVIRFCASAEAAVAAASKAKKRPCANRFMANPPFRTSSRERACKKRASARAGLGFAIADEPRQIRQPAAAVGKHACRRDGLLDLLREHRAGTVRAPDGGKRRLARGG